MIKKKSYLLNMRPDTYKLLQKTQKQGKKLAGIDASIAELITFAIHNTYGKTSINISVGKNDAQATG